MIGSNCLNTISWQKYWLDFLRVFLTWWLRAQNLNLLPEWLTTRAQGGILCKGCHSKNRCENLQFDSFALMQFSYFASLFFLYKVWIFCHALTTNTRRTLRILILPLFFVFKSRFNLFSHEKVFYKAIFDLLSICGREKCRRLGLVLHELQLTSCNPSFVFLEL